MIEAWGSGAAGGLPAGATEDPARVLAALSDALFTRNPDLVWDFGVDGTVERVNPLVTSVLGYEPGEVIGWHLRDLVTPDDAAHVDAAFRRALGGESGMVTFRTRHRDGRLVVLRATVQTLVLDGQVARVYLGCRDVTAAQATLAALAEREALYSLIVEQSPECVAVYQDERYVYLNPAGARMRGPDVVAADVIGRHWAAFLHPDDRPRLAAIYQQMLEAPEGTRVPVEKRLTRTDGGETYVEGTLTATRYRGRPAVHSFTRDVTARRRAEAEQMRGQRLEALGRLAAGVAHDFNNLLAVMLAAVEQAAGALPADSELQADLADAAAAARRGRGLTRQLLTFARHEPSEPRELDLNEVVRGMQDLLQRIAGPRVRLALSLAPDAGCVVADPTQAEQVLLNLVTNARDAMPDGGEILVETARSNGDLRLTVRDTGPGIPPEVRPHLFEPFFSTKAEGSGLGLATVYGVVTGAGGRVDVESEPGRGAAFHLHLPRARHQKS